MSKDEISYDIKLVHSIYRGNTQILLELSQKNLENNKLEFENYLKRDFSKDFNSQELSKLSNIDWIFLNSIYISLFSNFENVLFKYARIVEDCSTSNIKINDIRGQGHIDQYRKYLELVGKIVVAKQIEPWKELEIYKLVRNKLTHEGGYLIRNKKSDLEQKPEFKYLIENKVLLPGSFGHIRIREIHFLEKFSELTLSLSTKLLNEISALYKGQYR
ncbi:hypothetical protein [Brumimicrobium sp.]|uniref:hypothetical protein n=1 Tax=Brumimicrobium sp. TaxID=2029867 RepID=UPI003A92DC4D